MADLINRRGVAAWLDNMGYPRLADVVMDEKRFPPAQPEKRTDKSAETHACDCISRQAVIDAYGDWYVEEGTEEGFIGTVKQLLEGFPSAQPGRKRGKWIYGEDEYGIDGYHCDKCGFFVPWDYAHKFINYIEDYKFCPGCGADMREVDDERHD